MCSLIRYMVVIGLCGRHFKILKNYTTVTYWPCYRIPCKDCSFSVIVLYISVNVSRIATRRQTGNTAELIFHSGWE
jgi:hypothetical protein